MNTLIEIQDLQISFRNQESWKTIIKNSSFSLYENEILGIVGESGSGKSVTSLALMGLLPNEISRIDQGKIIFQGKDLTQIDETSFRKMRGKEISMIFQEPMSSLNPSITCGEQVAEILRLHTSLSEKEIKQEVLSLFEKVKLPNPTELYQKYPHQISGGQKQRVMISMAIACQPKVLIADEPTTALDVTVQKEIIKLLKELQHENQMSILFISHDLSLISEISDRVLVMYQGDIIEQGKTADIFHHPKETYTKALIASRPSLDVRLKRLPTIQNFLNNEVLTESISKEERVIQHQRMYNLPPLLQVKNVEKEYVINSGLFQKNKTFKAVNNVSIDVYEGETLGLVGESGCGKSTLGNAILLLDPPTKGHIFYKGKDITQLKKSEIKELRKEIQIIFQDPFASLNPKKTVLQTVIEPMQVHKLYANDKERLQKVIELLEKVGLGKEHLHRYPHEFSGGQRQRIGIARTIALQPKLIICDESVSALDISVQAQVLNLLNELKENFGFTYIFISHDLAVVKYMSDHIAVMQKGIIEEFKEADALYENPEKEYTKKLIDAIPKGL